MGRHSSFGLVALKNAPRAHCYANQECCNFLIARSETWGNLSLGPGGVAMHAQGSRCNTGHVQPFANRLECLQTYCLQRYVIQPSAIGCAFAFHPRSFSLNGITFENLSKIRSLPFMSILFQYTTLLFDKKRASFDETLLILGAGRNTL
jgi:hypothetical protein